MVRKATSPTSDGSQKENTAVNTRGQTTSEKNNSKSARRAARVESEEEDDEGEGTAKVRGLETSDTARGGFKAPMDWRSSISQNRFSSYLESWMRPQSPTGESKSPSTPEKKMVSEPKLVEQKTGDSVASSSSVEQSNGIDMTEFEQMLVCLSWIVAGDGLTHRRTIWV